MKTKILIVGMLLLSLLLVGCLNISASEEVKIRKEVLGEGNLSCRSTCVYAIDDIGGSKIRDGKIDGDWCVCYDNELEETEQYVTKEELIKILKEKDACENKQ